MFPTEMECTQCGQLAPVIHCVPIYDDPNRSGTLAPAPGTLEISCKIDCPQCGNRIQIIRIAVS
jgi:hypothetical protein